MRIVRRRGRHAGGGPGDRELLAGHVGGGLGRRRDRDVDEEYVLDELRGPHDGGAVRGDDHGVAVEDQFVLAADRVHVDDRRPGLGRTPLQQAQPEVVLVAFVR